MTQQKDATATVVLIGDGYVGKTSIFKSLQQTPYQHTTSANVYNETTLEKHINNRRFVFKIIDTAGQEEYDEMRRETYEKAHIFLLCFCVEDKVSYENVTSKWIPDIQNHRSKPIILLGTKVDLRVTPSNANASTERGIRLQKRIGAKVYIECSSKSGRGISDIVDAVVNVLVASENKKTCCVQ